MVLGVVGSAAVLGRAIATSTTAVRAAAGAQAFRLADFRTLAFLRTPARAVRRRQLDFRGIDSRALTSLSSSSLRTSTTYDRRTPWARGAAGVNFPFKAHFAQGLLHNEADYGEATHVEEGDDMIHNGEEEQWLELDDVDPEAERIFYGERRPFSDLGLSPALCNHLDKLGLNCSTAVQAAAIPEVLSGEDTLIGAETGSGKTLAYLLPVVERLIRGDAIAKDLPDELLGNARDWSMFPDVMVLVPNKELCDQVLSVLRGILGALEASGNTDVTAASMFGSSYEYPFSPAHPAPSILVCTPAFLHKYTNMRAIPMFCKATTLVMDEADMLMEGSYKKQLDDILTSFRRADKLAVARPDSVEGAGGVTKTHYILAAATVPSYGLKSVDQYIRTSFPAARKIQQVHMHCHHPAMQQDFVRTEGDFFHKAEAVRALLQENGPDLRRTMVFCNTASACKRAHTALEEAGFPAVPYHKDVVPLQRAQNLEDLRSGKAKILVCTDLAARGIDVPSVAHVIQLEMATNVVQHLHRLGRAARAGRTGRSTTFYDDSTKDLVDSIRDAGEGSRLDGSFSRQRGFRKKFKKYGPSRTPEGHDSDPRKKMQDVL